jgi:hypothetical protein
MAFEGDVATFPVGDLLAWLAQRRATGVLSLTRGLTARRFYLRAGEVRLVSSSEQEMLLGHLLVERALLKPEALAQALAARGRSRARLGRLLTRGGLVPRAELQAILADKTRRLLADAIAWRDGRFFYEAQEALSDPALDQRRARREDKRGIAVAVGLAAALEEIHRESANRGAAPGRPEGIQGRSGGGVDRDGDGGDGGDVIDVDDGDVLETLPMLVEPAAEPPEDPVAETD